MRDVSQEGEPVVPAGGSRTILIVDDVPENLAVLDGLLQPHYRIRAATSGEAALRIAVTAPVPELILLDVMMPHMDGYQVFARLRADPATRDIPVIFVTGMDSAEAETHGLGAGAVDYITKPINPVTVLARLHTQLELKHARDRLRHHNQHLEAEVASRVADNELVQEMSIRALAHLAEIRDPETGNHIRRTQGYVQQLSARLATHPRFASLLTDRFVKLLASSAQLHDIGKVGIPDAILHKAGPLTPEERRIMQSHSLLGSEAIDLAQRGSEAPLEFLVLAREIARSHHERWDGSGYPDGLAAEAIPISARIMALADVFDALVSLRPYKAPMSFEEAREVVVAGRGRHFDPDMVDTFLEHFDDFRVIAERFREPAPGTGE